MNPPAAGRAPSRFVRGRARGGGAYRPYFYFRRNGRVIPAGSSRGQPAGAQARGRAWSNRGATANSGSRTKRTSAPDCSFLRPEYYAAPEDGLQLQSILVDNPSACPGWRLYFMLDNYVAGNELAKRIDAVQEHYQRNPQKYDATAIQDSGYFQMPARGIIHDEQLKEAWPSLRDDMCQHPLRTLATLGVAMHSTIVTLRQVPRSPLQSTEEVYVPRLQRTRKIYVRPEEFAPVELISSISYERVDTLVALRGIVSSIGDPTYNFAWHAYRCSVCQTEQSLRQRGTYTPRPFNCKQIQCTAKDNFILLRSSPYTRMLARQIIRIEESNLSLLTDYDTTLPGTIDVELRHDLINAVHLGQEIVVTGVLKMHDLSEPGGGDVQSYLKAVSIQQARYVKREFTKIDLETIAMINSEPNSFKLLVQSLMPEVYGHELPKAACLLSLFGSGGSQLSERSNINVLLVGDPGTGKSKILESCTQISERASHINGKRGQHNKLSINFTGSNNKRVMHTGALLSANSLGHCIIDDVDKLASKQSLVLQSMQTGELNLPFANTFASFEAQPSIIACANPHRGQYDQGRYLLQNIRILPALLKEFHLVYVLLDRPINVARDVSLTEHVRSLHAGNKKRTNIAARYALKPKKSDSLYENTFESVPPECDEDSIMNQDFDLDKRLELDDVKDVELELLPPVLMKKYIAYARENVKPLLNSAASEAIKKHFNDLQQRSKMEHESSQIGMGQLLGLVHLSQARARLDLSSTVTPAHVRDVISLLMESITQTSLSNSPEEAANVPGPSGSKASQLRWLVRMMQMRSAALGRRIFEYEELKEMGSRAGITTGISHLVDLANQGGYLLKKGCNMYEVVPE